MQTGRRPPGHGRDEVVVSASTVNLRATPPIFASATASSGTGTRRRRRRLIVVGRPRGRLVGVSIDVVVHGLNARRQARGRRDGGLVGRALTCGLPQRHSGRRRPGH